MRYTCNLNLFITAGRIQVPITLRIKGNSALGPLDENVATLGEATSGPTMVAAGEIFAILLTKVNYTAGDRSDITDRSMQIVRDKIIL